MNRYAVGFALLALCGCDKPAKAPKPDHEPVARAPEPVIYREVYKHPEDPEIAARKYAAKTTRDMNARLTEVYHDIGAWMRKEELSDRLYQDIVVRELLEHDLMDSSDTDHWVDLFKPDLEKKLGIELIVGVRNDYRLMRGAKLSAEAKMDVDEFNAFSKGLLEYIRETGASCKKNDIVSAINTYIASNVSDDVSFARKLQLSIVFTAVFYQNYLENEDTAPKKDLTSV